MPNGYGYGSSQSVYDREGGGLNIKLFLMQLMDWTNPSLLRIKKLTD